MPAFTQLCQKYNISMAYEAMTFYPNKTGIKGRSIRRNEHKVVEIYEVDTYHKEIEKLNFKAFDTLGQPKFIMRSDSSHPRYHEDAFDEEETHYHLKFPFQINLSNIEEILEILVIGNIISIAERDKFISAYESANVLEATEQQALMARVMEPDNVATHREPENVLEGTDQQALMTQVMVPDNAAAQQEPPAPTKKNREFDHFQFFKTKNFVTTVYDQAHEERLEL